MSSSGSSTWLQRLAERGVIRVAASYAVIAWLLLQIADVTFEPLGVPRWVMVSLIVTAILGFRVAVRLRRQSILGGTGTAKQAIAVLPYQNLTTSKDGEVLAMGIAESVLHQLGNLAELDVISRTSSFTFGEREADAKEIGRQLGARYLLEGSVQSDRTRMRVTTQLIDTQTGADVWSMRFDRPPGDIFEVQDEIAMQVTEALELSLDRDALERMTGQGTTNLKAYLEFVHGRALLANS